MGGTVKGRCQGCGKEIELSGDTSEVCTLCEIDNVRETIRLAGWERPLPDDAWFAEAKAYLSELRRRRANERELCG